MVQCQDFLWLFSPLQILYFLSSSATSATACRTRPRNSAPAAGRRGPSSAPCTYWAATQCPSPPLSKRRNCAPGSWLRLALLRRTRVTTDAGAHAGLCQCHIQIRGRGRRCPYAGQPRLATFSAADESSIVPGMPTIVVRITLSELTNPTAPQHRYLCFSTHPPSLGYEYSSNTSATTSPTLNSMALGSYLH